jgi:hypothetical protein
VTMEVATPDLVPHKPGMITRWPFYVTRHAQDQVRLSY